MPYVKVLWQLKMMTVEVVVVVVVMLSAWKKLNAYSRGNREEQDT